MRKTAKSYIISFVTIICIFFFTGVTFATQSKVPKFIEVDKSYFLQGNPFTGQVYKVVEIDNTGWIKVVPADEVKPYYWVNLNSVQLIRPVNK